jgi:hypothetical protein
MQVSVKEYPYYHYTICPLFSTGQPFTLEKKLIKISGTWGKSASGVCGNYGKAKIS